jgi:hypothetical protein
LFAIATSAAFKLYINNKGNLRQQKLEGIDEESHEFQRFCKLFAAYRLVNS